MEQSNKTWVIGSIIAFVVIVAAAGAFLVHNPHQTTPTAPTTASLSGYCVGQTFTSGSTGHCVSDVQTMINYMEHSGLTQCTFQNGATLTVNATYDSNTTMQVKAIQQWASCYAKQEGFTSNIAITGSIDHTTWGEICTYGYTDPLHSSACGATSSITAGRDAGCAKLTTS